MEKQFVIVASVVQSILNVNSIKRFYLYIEVVTYVYSLVVELSHFLFSLKSHT